MIPEKPRRQIEHVACIVEQDDEGRTVILNADLVTGLAAKPYKIGIMLSLDFVPDQSFDPDDPSDGRE